MNTYLGYEILNDEQGFYIIGTNGLGESKRIYRDTEESLKGWIDSRLTMWLSLDKHTA